MNTNTDELLNQHYARLLGLGEEWEVTRVELNLSAKRLDIYLDYAARAAVCPRCGALAGELIEKALTPRQREMVCGVAIDMSAPYAKAIGEKLPDADIVYDRF
ncbi:MAG: transposase, partial [Kiritimatiellae bacterium]|nr:transposase [Kiritimatiellia bacterium]